MSTVLTFSDDLVDLLGDVVPPKAPPAFVDNSQTGEPALGAPEAPGDGVGLPGPIPAVLPEGELAALFGVSGVLIRQRARDGDFVKVARGRYDVRASILRYTARLRAGSRVNAGDPDLKAERLSGRVSGSTRVGSARRRCAGTDSAASPRPWRDGRDSGRNDPWNPRSPGVRSDPPASGENGGLTLGLLSRLFSRPAPVPATRRFDAAAGGRRWSGTPHFGRIGPETLAAAAPIRSRARYFAANNGWAANGVGALVAGLVGAGIVAASDHPDPAARKAIGEAFDRWAKLADAEGRTDLYGLQAAAARALIVDGEAFLHMELRREGLRLRLLPAEMVGESDTRDLPGGGYVVAGVEFDATGRRVAYHVLKSRPTETFAHQTGTIRVPAEDMLHVMHPLGAGQVRGVSWLAPILLRLAEIDQLEDALLVGTKTAAMFAGFVLDLNGTSSDPLQSNDLLSTGIAPGGLHRLPAGQDVKFATPQQANQTSEFVSHQIRAVAAGLGVPAHLVSGDLREANYGSLRAGLVAFRQRLEQVQFQTLVPQMCAPIFARAVAAMVLRGDLAADGFEAAPDLFTGAEFYPPPMPWIDPQKDVAAIREAIDARLMSRRQAVALAGYNVETLDAEIAADRQREAALGLTSTEGGTDAA